MSSIPQELLDILRCPKCKGTLRSGGVPKEYLECSACRLRYAVRDGIPIMLVDDATPC